MAPAGPPFYTTMKRGKQKGCDWPFSKGEAGWEVGAWMSDMLPDTG